jgi:hypothetical protein
MPEVNLLAFDTGALRRGALAREGLVAALGSLGRGDWRAAKRVLLAQELCSGQADDGRGDALIGARNAHCVAELAKYLGSRGRGLEEGGSLAGKPRKPRKVAVLFGGLHCRDLEARLGDRFGAKRRRGAPQWRSAWAIEAGHDQRGGAPQAPSAGTNYGLPPLVAAVVPLYFLVGALDWLTLLRTLVEGGVGGGAPWLQVALEAALYVGRHAVLLLGLSKFAVEWDTRA